MNVRALAAIVAASCLSACSYPSYAPPRQAVLAEAPPGVERGQAFFRGAHGTRLLEQWWRPRGEQPRAAVAVVHGLKDHGGRYGELAERLVAQGASVHAMDLRGHAHSEGVRVDVADFDDYLADVDAFLREVRAREGNRPLFVFGHSMGGAIVTLHAITRQPGFAGVVLSGAALQVDVPAFKVVGTKVVAALSPDSGIFNLDLADFSRDPKVVAACKADPMVYQDGAPARTARELLGAIDRIQGRMQEVRVPLLILHGGADKVTPPQGSKQLHERAGSPDKTLKIYDGLYHDILHEPERERVLADITNWIGKRTSQ